MEVGDFVESCVRLLCSPTALRVFCTIFHANWVRPAMSSSIRKTFERVSFSAHSTPLYCSSLVVSALRKKVEVCISGAM